MHSPAWRAHSLAVAGYLLVSVAFTWPLVLYLGTRLPGSPGGDTGVYLWNLWVFRHEVIAGHFPFYTTAIFSLDPAANLALHNYTVFSDIVAFPLLPVLGLVRTFNVVHLGLFVLNGWAMFALVRRLTGQASIAWIAGVLFAFSPTLVARSTAHASLLAAAPLPLFVLCLLNLGQAKPRRWAVAAGATLAWAATCDPYYGIYCVMLGAWHLASRVFDARFERRERAAAPAAALLLEGLVVLLLAVSGVIVGSGGFTLQLAGVSIGLRTLYTPVLLLALAVGARLALAVRVRVGLRPASCWIGLLRAIPWGLATSVVLLSPALYALAMRMVQGTFVRPRIFWRTSTPGVDLLSLVGPNPNLAWLGGWRNWLAGRGGGFEENVASLTVSALGVLAAAVLWARFRPSRYWAGLAVVSASLTLGPFVHVAGVNSCIPTPWAFLRYAPVIGAARAPARFAVVAILAVSVLVALAVRALVERYPAQRRLLLASAAALLMFELFPAPRPLYSAGVPRIYERVAADPRDVRVLELPFGVRDGLSSYGDFRPTAQYFQTRHEKRLIGGYMSRVSDKRVIAIRKRPILAALMRLSEGGEVSSAETESLAALAPRFVEGAQLGYVVMDRDRVSDALIAFASKVLVLEKIDSDGSRELYRPHAAAPARAAAESLRGSR